MVKPTEDFDIVGSYNNQRFPNMDAERSVNLFEYIDQKSKKPKTLISTSGLENTGLTFTKNVPTDGFRMSFVFNNVAYFVVGNQVYELSQAFVLSYLGQINTSVGYIGVDANTYQIAFVDGTNGWIIDTNTSTLVQITDPAFPGNANSLPNKPLDICQLDGFFVVTVGNTNTFLLSSLNNGLIWGSDFTVVGGSTGNAFLATSGGSPNLVLSTGTNANYQIGTTITFSGGGTLPTGTPPINTTSTFFVVGKSGTNTITISPTDGGTPITFSTTGTAPIFLSNGGQLQQGAITSHPGTIVACRTLHRRLFLFSQFFTEVWENAGAGTNLPFRRNNASLMEYGTPAIGSIATGFDTLIFLSQDRDGLGSVMEVTGSVSLPVSPKSLDFQLAQYAANPAQGVSDARGFFVKENGLIFYRLNFTAANHTFVYGLSMSDPENPRWHEEEVLNGNRHPGQTHIYFNGNNYLGHFAKPILYLVDDQFSTNDGEAIRRMRISKSVTPLGYQRTRIDRFQLDLVQGTIDQLENIVPSELDLLAENGLSILTESGIEIILQQGSTNFTTNSIPPEVFLSVSKDGGQSFGYLIQSPMGRIGQRTFRTVWRKLGVIPRGQGFVVKIEFFNMIPFIVLGAAWGYEVMPE